MSSYALHSSKQHSLRNHPWLKGNLQYLAHSIMWPIRFFYYMDVLAGDALVYILGAGPDDTAVSLANDAPVAAPKTPTKSATIVANQNASPPPPAPTGCNISCFCHKNICFHLNEHVHFN